MLRHAFHRLPRLAVIITLFLLSFNATMADAQEKRLPEGTPLPADAEVYPLHDHRPPADRLERSREGRPAIMLTGYWPPTNDMLRQFSPNPEQNPDGWAGENWEDRGYDVYAFFPEFPGGLGQGEGDFEVDYQDTSADFWPLADQLKPIAIITFGRAGEDSYWEIEYRTRNLPCSSWVNDYTSPFKPTPCPPDDTVASGTIRYSTLPMHSIRAAISTAGLGIIGRVDMSSTDYAGAFLCEFVGYHASWYHDLHADYTEPDINLAAGHIHVGSNILTAEATAAVEVTLRTLITHLDQERFLAGDMNCDRFITVDDIAPFALALVDPDSYETLYPDCDAGRADMNGDSLINGEDVEHLVEFFQTDCNQSGLPDETDIELGLSEDCNDNGIPDECDIAAGTSLDLNGNGIPDSCEDESPPEPNPLGFLPGEPDTYASGPHEITLTAETATDDTPPIEYAFHCISGACNNRDWSPDPVYVDTGLNANYLYTYKVRARDSATPPNITDLGSAPSVQVATLAYTPGAPGLSLGSPPSSSIMLSLDTGGNPAWTPFAIQCTNTTDPAWSGLWVASDGTPSAAPVWKTAGSWGVLTLSGLQAGTEYTFAAKARNFHSVETELGPEASVQTTE